MSVDATRRAAIMPLRLLVERYLALAGAFGTPVALSSFGLSAPQTEKVFSGYDEDYHISRFFRFSNSDGVSYNVDKEPATHITISAEIRSIL
ncbi:MAG: hypothetical protein ABSG69_07810 [Candidatus Acidiferrum sp.]|jgi:hypothetical protein